MKLIQKYYDWRKSKKIEMQLQSIAIGLNSTVDYTQDMHIIMLDYDIKDIQRVKESVWELQEFWQLSDACIYRTKNGHHVFFWYDHVPYGRLKMIIEYAKYVDPMFKYISRYYDHKTIRVAGKYRNKDIWFVEKMAGIREPTDDEFQLGKMKEREHQSLSGVIPI